MSKNQSKNPAPSFHFEDEMGRAHGAPIAGIDEAGRGPWAGPVVAAAVILNRDDVPEGINDSKKLSEARREDVYEDLITRADVGVGIAEVDRIDTLNILQATLWAMREAVSNLSVLPSAALIDGNKLPELPCASKAVVKGDSHSLSIAAASIVAKVTRDRIMGALSETYPHYGWERNKGYGTAEHRKALEVFGVCEHHRKSFKPIANLTFRR